VTSRLGRKSTGRPDREKTMAKKSRSKKLGKSKSLKEVKPLTTSTGPNLFAGTATGKHFATATLHVK
jgi:hypothetical protein